MSGSKELTIVQVQADMISYANSIGVNLDCPEYVDVHAELIICNKNGGALG